ncbi:cytochrome c biogenesis protein CcsA [Brachybacterium sp. GPGPB12]|uniref:cytochrome c biogenesis protein CcsA n=1 Tax=Brachybacterium sp. GPGPB12 TaxID=3023517 RepID=UPI0031344EAF
MISRALATQRVPWANMYEFATTSTAIVMVAFLAFSVRRTEPRALGTFVVGPVSLVLLLAQTFWIVPAAELTPSLQNSHWIYIHIGVAIMATALSILGAVVASMQPLQAKHERVLAERAATEEFPEHWGRFGHVLDRSPSSSSLEALSFRIHSVAFVCWTFTLIFGAIWAREAWGRFWGWDPKEVWTFIIWVIYAAYLHARATGGFRGSRAAGPGPGRLRRRGLQLHDREHGDQRPALLLRPRLSLRPGLAVRPRPVRRVRWIPRPRLVLRSRLCPREQFIDDPFQDLERIVEVFPAAAVRTRPGPRRDELIDVRYQLPGT